MKIKTLRNMLFDGKIVPSETILVVKDTLARDLLASGRAELAESEEEAEAVVEAEGTKPFPGTEEEEDEPAEPAKPKRK